MAKKYVEVFNDGTNDLVIRDKETKESLDEFKGNMMSASQAESLFNSIFN